MSGAWLIAYALNPSEQFDTEALAREAAKKLLQSPSLPAFRVGVARLVAVYETRAELRLIEVPAEGEPAPAIEVPPAGLAAPRKPCGCWTGETCNACAGGGLVFRRSAGDVVALGLLRDAFVWLQTQRHPLDVAPDWYINARKAFPELAAAEVPA